MISQELKKIDPALFELIELEVKRQRETIDLIPSECLAPLTVLEVLGSPLTNKYSEGQAGKRYYPGNAIYDQIEELAKQRAKEVFGLDDNWEANVQALSGGPANLAIYFGLLEPGDILMGMELASGGHLSHGHKVNVSGKIFRPVQYGLGEDGRLDFNAIEKLAQDSKPKIIVSGFTAYPLIIDFEKFGAIAKKVGSWHMADISHIAGLVAAGVHPSPFPFADIVMATTHKTLNGPRGAIIFSRKELSDKINRGVFPSLQGGPHNNNIAAIALCLEIAKTPQFKE
ncbi:MAG: serine hydroxymethyltransferase, partial [Patescibacteria group bacterium]